MTTVGQQELYSDIADQLEQTSLYLTRTASAARHRGQVVHRIKRLTAAGALLYCNERAPSRRSEYHINEPDAPRCRGCEKHGAWRT